MAKSYLQNPRYYSGPKLQRVTLRATDSKTWKGGEFGRITADGLVQPCATDEVSIDVIFGADQDSSTSSSDVVCFRIPSSETKFVGYICNDDADIAAAATHRALSCGIHVGGNTVSVNINETTALAVKIDALIVDVEPWENDSTDDPGQVVFHVLQSVLDATGAAA